MINQVEKFIFAKAFALNICDISSQVVSNLLEYLKGTEANYGLPENIFNN